MPLPEGEQRCHGACNSGQAQNDDPVNGCYHDIDVASQSRAQTQVAARIVGDDGVYSTYKGLLHSVITAFQIQQDGLAPTALVIEAPVRADYREFAADCKIPDIQAEFLQSFAAQVCATGFKQAAQITVDPGGTRVPTGGFVEAIR